MSECCDECAVVYVIEVKVRDHCISPHMGWMDGVTLTDGGEVEDDQEAYIATDWYRMNLPSLWYI